MKLKSGEIILCSYHVSQQNTFTGRLTEEMFDAVLERAKELSGKTNKGRVDSRRNQLNPIASNMMKKQLAIVVIALLALAACGSSGSRNPFTSNGVP